MNMAKPAIIYLIVQDGPLYFCEDGWGKNINDACLYTPADAQKKLKQLSGEGVEASIRCVIQNAHFNFYDGKRFVYSLREAMLYPPKEAEPVLKTLR